MGAHSNPEYNTSVKSIPIYRLNKGTTFDLSFSFL